MEFEKLFKVLVVSGSVMVGGCAAKNAGTSPADTPGISKARTEKLDCEALCDEPNNGRGSVCPDPSSPGSQNCCWLMLERHECCP